VGGRGFIIITIIIIIISFHESSPTSPSWWVVRSARFFWFEHGGSRVGRARRAILFVLNMAVCGWVAHGGLRVGRAQGATFLVWTWWYAGGSFAARGFFGLSMVVRGWVARSARIFENGHVAWAGRAGGSRAARDFFENGGLRGWSRAARVFFGLSMMVRGWVARSVRISESGHVAWVGRAQRAIFVKMVGSRAARVFFENGWVARVKEMANHILVVIYMRTTNYLNILIVFHSLSFFCENGWVARAGKMANRILLVICAPKK